MIFHCPKCGAECKSLFFDRRGKIIYCDVCVAEVTEMKLEEKHYEKEKRDE